MSDLAPAVCGENVLFRRISFDTVGTTRHGTTYKHRAIDVYGQRGYHVHAPRGGEILPLIPNNSAGGNHVTLLGDDNKKRYMAHMDSVIVRVGQKVSAGELLGTLGHSGDTRVDHCHYSRRNVDCTPGADSERCFENPWFDMAVLPHLGANLSGRQDWEFRGAVACPLSGNIERAPQLPPEVLARAPVRRVRRGNQDGVELDLGDLGKLFLTIAAAKLLGV